MANVEGRATAITVLTPVKPWGRIVLALVFWAAATSRHAEKLQQLSFIHYARWAVIPRFPDGGAGERLHHTYLLFESNFNGTWDQYIDAFSEVVPARMKGIWGSRTASRGRSRSSRSSVHPRNEYVANHYWSAYPGATTTEIISAKRVAAALDGLRRRAPRARPGCVRGRLRADAHRASSGTYEADATFRPGVGAHRAHPDRARPRERARRVPGRAGDGEGSPLARVPGTHLARWVVIVAGQRGASAAEATQLKAPRLLFTRTSTGRSTRYLDALRTGLAADGDAISGNASDIPGAPTPRRRRRGSRPTSGEFAVLRRVRRPERRRRCTTTSHARTA